MQCSNNLPNTHLLMLAKPAETISKDTHAWGEEGGRSSWRAKISIIVVCIMLSCALSYQLEYAFDVLEEVGKCCAFKYTSAASVLDWWELMELKHCIAMELCQTWDHLLPPRVYAARTTVILRTICIVMDAHSSATTNFLWKKRHTIRNVLGVTSSIVCVTYFIIREKSAKYPCVDPTHWTSKPHYYLKLQRGIIWSDTTLLNDSWSCILGSRE